MHCSLVVFLLILTSSLFAQNKYNNLLGWDSGPSYRRYLTQNLWVGTNIRGNIQNNTHNNTENVIRHVNAIDSTYIENTLKVDSTKRYIATIKLLMGKSLFKLNNINVDLFGAGSYSYQKDEYGNSNAYGEGINSDKYISHTIAGSVGFEPQVMILERIVIGTQFGVTYSYMFGPNSSEYTYSNSSEIYSRTQNGKSNLQTIETFGNLSLSMSLVGHLSF
jgi:hypothetical protein